MKLETVRAGLGKPYAAVIQPLQSMLGSTKKNSQGWEPPQAFRASSLGDLKKDLLEGINAWDITATPVTSTPFSAT